MVTVEANDEFLYLDLAFPTTKLHGRGFGEDGGDGGDDVSGEGLNGMEAAFQVGSESTCYTRELHVWVFCFVLLIYTGYIHIYVCVYVCMPAFMLICNYILVMAGGRMATL